MGRYPLVADERQQSNVTGPLDGDRQFTLMSRTGAGNTAGQNLRALRNEAAQTVDVFVVDILNPVDAEAANLFAALAPTGTVRAILSHESVPP